MPENQPPIDDNTHDRPLFNPDSIPKHQAYPKRHRIEDLKENPRVKAFLDEALNEIYVRYRDSYGRVADIEGETYEQWAAGALLVRLGHEFPGVHGLLIEDDERVAFDLKNIGIGPSLPPIPEHLQMGVIGLALAATTFHRILVDIFVNTSKHGIDARAAMSAGLTEELDSSENVLELWQHHLGMDVYELLRDING